MSRSRRVDTDEYTERTGRRQPVDDSEDAWQWDYRGTPEERKRLLEEFGLEPQADGEQTFQEETLF